MILTVDLIVCVDPGLFNGDALGKLGPVSHRATIPAYHVTVASTSTDTNAVTNTNTGTNASSNTSINTSISTSTSTNAAHTGDGTKDGVKAVTKAGRALDVRRAVFLSRSLLGTSGATLDAKWYASLDAPMRTLC